MIFELPIIFQKSTAGSHSPVCPSCAQKFHQGAENCPHCGFSLGRAKDKFGDFHLTVRRIDDKAGCLRKNQRENLTQKLEELEKKCPPVVLSVHIPLSVERQQLRQYSVWALNSMTLNEADFDCPDWTLLLVLDINNRAAVFSYGYKLEPYLSEETLYPALLAGSTYLRDGVYEQAILLMMKKAQKILIKQSAPVRKAHRHELKREKEEGQG